MALLGYSFLRTNDLDYFALCSISPCVSCLKNSNNVILYQASAQEGLSGFDVSQ